MITKITNWLRSIFSTNNTVTLVDDPTEHIRESMSADLEEMAPTFEAPSVEVPVEKVTPKITETVVTEPSKKKRGRKPKFKNKK